MPTRSIFRGCLLGGALGDALGAPIEFLNLRAIREAHGPRGLTDLVEPEITDDTQMTLFTAEALVRARAPGSPGLAVEGWHAYLRWLSTQRERVPAGTGATLDGWLLATPALHARRAPGNTCLSALRSGRMGTPAAPLNDSKGCGTVMRVAPIGLALAPREAFEAGCALSAITHGHPTGWLAGGALAAIVSRVARGEALREAARAVAGELEGVPGAQETVAALRGAFGLAARGEPTPEALETLGGGWVAEEALAIGLAAALVARDFAHGVLLAVNHSGDSDSTGAIAGNLLGAALGEAALPAAWVVKVELGAEVLRAADELHAGC
ncbi:MAG: ADP-ribosylglycohydrolase family protein [Anaeromyxobacteraceae bacterium]